MEAGGTDGGADAGLEASADRADRADRGAAASAGPAAGAAADARRRVFIAGIMQGSRRGDGIADQGYRARITQVLQQHLPEVEVVDPLMLYPESIVYTPEQARHAFIDLAETAGCCDVVVAFAPEASMGTAIEMWQAYRAGARVYTISPMRANWVVAYLSEQVFDTLEEFLAFVEAGGLGVSGHNPDEARFTQ
jgi:hypothetical protein